MKYLLNVESKTYPVEGLQLPTAGETLEGRGLSFVSPVRLPVGERCLLMGEAEGYQLVINGCFGFAYSLKYLISGTIAGKLTPAQ
jgi:hypothetical protein